MLHVQAGACFVSRTTPAPPPRRIPWSGGAGGYITWRLPRQGEASGGR